MIVRACGPLVGARCRVDSGDSLCLDAPATMQVGSSRGAVLRMTPDHFVERQGVGWYKHH